MNRTNPPSHKIGKRLTAAVLSAVLLSGVAMPRVLAADESTQAEISTTTFTYPLEHTFAEINQYFVDHPYDTSLPDEYDIQPDMTNAEINAKLDGGEKLENHPEYWDILAGKLSDATLTNALNATNFMRYSAGLQELYIHTAGSMGGRQWRAQAGAAILATLGIMVHDVPKDKALAAGISEGLYGWAKAGPGGSNCVAGYGVANKMVNSFMPDMGNDGRGLSHRSYILNPSLAGTGFGAAKVEGKGSAVTMFVTYTDKDPYGINAVMWPSRKQPIETFKTSGTADNPYKWNPWSFFCNVGSVDNSKLKVTLECNGQVEVLERSKLTATQLSENRLFTSDSNPLRKLIVFRPSTAYGAGDKVHVTIEGIVGTDNLPIPVEYDVHFFQTGTLPYPNLEEITVSRSLVEEASVTLTSDYEGKIYYVLCEADEPAPTVEDILNNGVYTTVADTTVLKLTELSGSEAKKLYYVTASAELEENKTVTDATKSGELSGVGVIDIPAITQYIVPTVTAPTANTLTYNGEAQSLVTAGSTTAGTLEYKLGTNGAYSTELPKATDAGDYTVYYRVKGNAYVFDVAEQTVSVTIARANITLTALDREIWVGDALPDLSSPAEGVDYTVSGLKNGDTLGGTLRMEYQKDGQAVTPDVTKAGAYDIAVLGATAPAGDNYTLTAENGVLTISERASTATINYSVKLADMANGAVTLSHRYAPRGRTVTLTVTPDEGYALSALTVKTQLGVEIELTDAGEGKYTFVMPAGVVTVRAEFKLRETEPEAEPETPKQQFEDVTEQDYYYDAVQWAVENQVTEGMTETQFEPHISCTRAQMVMFLWRLAGSPEPQENSNPFSDLSRDAYYYKAVLWAVQNGITNGISATEFAPDLIVTRGQVAAFLHRLEGTEGDSANSGFLDVADSTYYAAAIAWAKAAGITDGVGDDLFAPDAECTRAQIVTMLYRLGKK